MAGRILWMMRIHRAFCDEWGMFLDKVQFCSPKSNVRVARVARHTAEAAHARQPVRWDEKIFSPIVLGHETLVHDAPLALELLGCMASAAPVQVSEASAQDQGSEWRLATVQDREMVM